MSYLAAKLFYMALTASQIKIKREKLPVSQMAETLIGSEIIKQAAEVNEKIKQGEKIYNLTIGDFDPKIFPIPQLLEKLILEAYQNKQTNYPAANGIIELRKAVSSFLRKNQGLEYNAEEILITAGARPAIYAIYQTLLDPKDKVIFPIPSWNNNHYCHLSGTQGIFVETTPENNFMPTAGKLKPYLKDAVLLSLCSPLNPTGTVFSKEALMEICEAVAEENAGRNENQKPLYIMYDQIYCGLLHGETKHYDPVSLLPELKDYTIYVDGISKCFAATGVRVGWAFGPQRIIDKMKAILSHIGAWAPKAEQMATAKFLEQEKEVNNFVQQFSSQVCQRLEAIYKGISQLKKEGLPVDVIAPQAAIYLTVCFNLIGRKTKDGKTFANSKEMTSFLLDKAKLAVVPFSSFGTSNLSPWYRLSVGTCKMEDIEGIIGNVRNALMEIG